MPNFDSDFQSKRLVDIDAGRVFLYSNEKLESCWAMKIANNGDYNGKPHSNGQILLFKSHSESGPALTVIADNENFGLWIDSKHAVRPVLKPSNFEFGLSSNRLTSLVIHGSRMYFRAKMENKEGFVLVDCLNGSLKQDIETSQATIEIQKWLLVTEAENGHDNVLYSTIPARTLSGSVP
jgi:hypothetical protein